MSTVTEIADAIPKLTTQELREVERAVLNAYRERKVGLLFEDAYGALTEQDMMALREEAVAAIDGKPAKP